jgi:four helix bundle protein
MGKNGFRDLLVWKKSKDLAVYLYKLTNTGPFNRDFGMRDQIRRAAVSIPSNITEGDERDTNKDSVRFLYIAKGSLAEILTQLEICKEIGYITEEEFLYISHEYTTVGKMLGKLIKIRSIAYNL